MRSRHNRGILDQVKRKQNLGPTDRPFTIALIVLTLFGLLMVFSASMYTSAVKSSTGSGYTQFAKQAFFVVLGLIILYIGSFVDYRKYKNYKVALFFLVITAILLGLVKVAGAEVNGAKRWLSLGPVTFQPSEFAKLTGIIFASTVVSERKEVYHSFLKFSLHCVLPMLGLCFLAAIEPSLSAAMAIGFGMLCVYFFSGIDFKFFIPYLAIIILAVAVSLKMQPWRIDRILALFGNRFWRLAQGASLAEAWETASRRCSFCRNCRTILFLRISAKNAALWAAFCCFCCTRLSFTAALKLRSPATQSLVMFTAVQ
jgi:cell division protein FtsW (lipid II flippase)